MRKINVYNFISLDGYYKGLGGDLSWHKHDTEESEYGQEGLQSENILLFGRVTYQMMAGFWPTEQAMQVNPEMAKCMNSAEKIVCSRTLETAEWNNTTIIKDMIGALREMKLTPGKNMTVLGSGNIVSQLAENNLIDSYEIMIDPVAIGKGTSIFSGLNQTLNLKLTGSRTFKSGVILLNYEPA